MGHPRLGQEGLEERGMCRESSWERDRRREGLPRDREGLGHGADVPVPSERLDPLGGGRCAWGGCPTGVEILFAWWGCWPSSGKDWRVGRGGRKGGGSGVWVRG